MERDYEIFLKHFNDLPNDLQMAVFKIVSKDESDRALQYLKNLKAGVKLGYKHPVDILTHCFLFEHFLEKHGNSLAKYKKEFVEKIIPAIEKKFDIDYENKKKMFLHVINTHENAIKSLFENYKKTNKSPLNGQAYLSKKLDEWNEGAGRLSRRRRR